MTKQQYEDYQRAFSSFLEREEIEGFGSCPGRDEEYFSWHSCDCCGTPLGGNRQEVMGYRAGVGPTGPYEICADCVYYEAYGRLDDTIMMEIEG